MPTGSEVDAVAMLRAELGLQVPGRTCTPTDRTAA
jgi:hypothetical protein